MGFSKVYTPELFQFVQDHLQEDPAQLLLKHHQNTSLDIKEAVQQIAARQKAAGKLPMWVANQKVVFPASISLEQCSSELTAIFKRRFVKGECLVDLTGGFGVDTFYLGEQFQQVVYLERQEKLAEIVRFNFHHLSIQPDKYAFLSSESIGYLKNAQADFDWLYVDPARRGGYNQKLYKLADCEPDILGNWDLLTQKAKNIMVKASPMLDIKEAIRELPVLSSIHVVAVKNEVKEILLVWHKEGTEQGVKVSAWNLVGDHAVDFTFGFEGEEATDISYGLPEKYLVIPSAAILKAGAFKSFGKRSGLKKLHPNTHLYTADFLPENLQGRAFEILSEVKLDKKAIKKSFPGGKVNVLVRNHPLKPEVIKKKFRLKDGGEDFLIACTLMDGSAKAFHCRRI
ncbi:SAM-dependent methyltransferase [Echinicola sediminis]